MEMSLASFLRFWAVPARRNSSLGPHMDLVIEHLDLLSLAPRRGVSVGLRDLTRQITCALMDAARDFASGRVRAASRLQLLTPEVQDLCSSASRTLSGVIGSRRRRARVALQMALAIAGAAPTSDGSPTPLAPTG